MRAMWNSEVIAESDDTVVLEGNHYFPRESLRSEFFSGSPRTSVCPWKGTASYLDIEVGGRTNAGAAWYYPQRKPAATEVTGRVAFWKGVDVTD